MAKFGKKNEVKLDPLAYNFMLIGESGIGKTTVIKEYCEALAGEDGYLFLEIGKEDGADAIEGIVYEEVDNWKKFKMIINDVLENRTTEYKDLRVVVIDPIDELFKLAEPEVVRMHNSDNPEKATKTIKGAFGGFGGGEDQCIKIVLDMLWSLKKVGVSFISIGHTKSRTVEDPVTGESYTQLTTNMSQRYFNAVKTKVHFLGVAAIDRTIVQEKTGKKDFVTKADIKKGVIKDETRKITFRDDSYVIDSKSRFSEIIESIPLDADALIKAFKDAILVEQSKSGKSLSQTQKEQDAAEIEKLKKIALKEEEDRAARESEKELKKVIDKIAEFIKENKSDLSIIKPILDLTKELGYKNPTLIDDIDDAKQVAALIK